MLKKIIKEKNYTYAYDAGVAGGYDAEAAYQACLARVAACEAAKQAHQDAANIATRNADEADENIDAYDTQIQDLQSKRESLSDIKGQYSAFQSSLNNAWTGYTDLNGYKSLGEDMNCIQNFCDELGTMMSTLESEKAKWVKYSQEQRKIAENEQKAANNMVCGSC